MRMPQSSPIPASGRGKGLAAQLGLGTRLKQRDLGPRERVKLWGASLEPDTNPQHPCSPCSHTELLSWCRERKRWSVVAGGWVGGWVQGFSRP